MDAVTQLSTPYIVSTNTSKISEAKVFILLSDPRFQTDSLHNQYQIRQFYQEKDIILIEDDETKDAEALDRRQIYSLGSGFHVEGWDDHAISSRIARIRQIADRVKEVSRKLLNANIEEAEQIEGYICLKAFVYYLKKNQLDKQFSVQAPAWLEQAAKGDLTQSKDNYNEKNVFLKACSEAVEKVINGYAAHVFPQRRGKLKSTIADYCKREEIGKIFVCVSINFFDPRNALLKPQAEEMIQSLGETPYIIINPSHGIRIRC